MTAFETPFGDFSDRAASTNLVSEPPDAGSNFDTALAVGLGEVATGHVGTGSDRIDFYSFVAPTEGLLRVDLTGLSSDIDLAILSSGSVTLAVSNLGSNLPEHVSFHVNAGETYYFDVYRFNGDSDYSLIATYDPFTGTSGDDTIAGDDASNQIFGLEGNDSITGGAGLDSIYGADGNDLLNGNTGADWIFGGGGNDSVSGGQDNDLLYGGKGWDTLVGGEGADILHGGVGLDLFDVRDTDHAVDTIAFQRLNALRADGAREKVVGFESGSDHLDFHYFDADHSVPHLQHLSFGGATPVAHGIWAVAIGGDVLVSADITGDAVADFELVLLGVTSVSAGDFVL